MYCLWNTSQPQNYSPQRSYNHNRVNMNGQSSESPLPRIAEEGTADRTLIPQNGTIDGVITREPPSASPSHGPRSAPPGSRHTNNLFQVSAKDAKEYRTDTWKWMVELHKETPQLLFQSPQQIAVRESLVNKVRIACSQLGMDMVVLYKSVVLLDYYMDAHLIPGDLLDTIAFACISVAAKTYNDRNKLHKIKIPIKNFGKLEFKICQHMKWRLLFPTPANFANLLAEYEFEVLDELVGLGVLNNWSRTIADKLINKYLNLTLSDIHMSAVNGAVLACACFACARKEAGMNAWPEHLAHLSGVTKKTLMPVVGQVLLMYKRFLPSVRDPPLPVYPGQCNVLN